jgi:hypothetical protein
MAFWIKLRRFLRCARSLVPFLSIAHRSGLYLRCLRITQDLGHIRSTSPRFSPILPPSRPFSCSSRPQDLPLEFARSRLRPQDSGVLFQLPLTVKAPTTCLRLRLQRRRLLILAVFIRIHDNECLCYLRPPSLIYFFGGKGDS